MLEALLAGGGGGGYYPNSGPGPKKLLVGDEQLGYFGTVSEDLLNNPADVIVGALARFNPAVNYATFNNALWNKFFFQGKVLYLSIKPIVYGFSYHDIARTGLLLGTDGNATWGAYASYPSYSVKQNFRIFAKDNGASKSLKVRAIANTPRNTSVVSATSEAFLLLSTHFGTAPNEVSRSPFFQKAIVPPSEPIQQICGVVDLAGNQGFGCAWTHILRSTPTQYVTYINAAVEAQVNYFRPVLELETELDTTFKYVYPVTDVVGNSDTNLFQQPAVVEPDIDLKQIAFESISATGLTHQNFALEVNSPEAAVVKFSKTLPQVALQSAIDTILLADVKKASEKDVLLAQGSTIESISDPAFTSRISAFQAIVSIGASGDNVFNPYFKSSVSADLPAIKITTQKV